MPSTSWPTWRPGRRSWRPATASTTGASGGSDVASETKPTDVKLPTGAAELRKLLDRAHSGDKSTLPAVRQFLREPSLVDSFGGDLARQAELSFIDTAAGKDL